MVAPFLAFMAVAAAPRIHSVTDIAHDFSFYMDGRFAANYVQPNGVDVRNWGTLHKFDFTNVNLAVLSASATPCPYLPQDLATMRKFAQDGGAVLILGEYGIFRNEKKYHQNDLAGTFGAEFVDQAAAKPLKAHALLKAAEVFTYGSKRIALKSPGSWTVLVSDSAGQPVLARRAWGKGTVIVGSRNLFGHNPDASDAVNDVWVKPMLLDAVKNKPVDSSRTPNHASPELIEKRDGLTVKCSEYMKPFGDEIMAIYREARPKIEKIMGVPPSPGMMTSLILLPTGGGGFSSGTEIGLGTWWGDFPAKRYGMIELLAHEGTHSWVLPFPEPMWNEGIATYVGILTGMAMGETEDAQATLKGWIEGLEKEDPDKTKFDIANGKSVPHIVGMAKPMWIFEQLRKEKPDIVARYFQTKRKLIDPAKQSKFTPDDSVAVLSIAAGRDLFPWFQSLGITVDRSKTGIQF